MGLVVIPNMIALAILWPQVRAKTKEYFSDPKWYNHESEK